MAQVPGGERVYRARVADALRAVTFPADKEQIVFGAQRQNVPSDVLAALLRLPERRYASLQEVLDTVGPPPPTVW